MLPEPEEPPKPNGVLVSQNQSALSDLDPPDFSPIVVRSTKNKAALPANVNVGTTRPQTPADEVTSLEAAKTTANQLTDTWFEHAASVQSALVCAIAKAQPTGTSNWNNGDQLAEMQQSGLDP